MGAALLPPLGRGVVVLPPSARPGERPHCHHSESMTGAPGSHQTVAYLIPEKVKAADDNRAESCPGEVNALALSYRGYSNRTLGQDVEAMVVMSS